MPEIFKENERLLYFRAEGGGLDDSVDESPYWRKFVALGASVTEMLFASPENSEENLNQEGLYVLRGNSGPYSSDVKEDANKDEEVLAIDLPFPMDSSGAPKEKVLEVLREFICEDEISELFAIITSVEEATTPINDLSELETQFIHQNEGE